MRRPTRLPSPCLRRRPRRAPRDERRRGVEARPQRGTGRGGGGPTPAMTSMCGPSGPTGADILQGMRATPAVDGAMYRTESAFGADEQPADGWNDDAASPRERRRVVRDERRTGRRDVRDGDGPERVPRPGRRLPSAPDEPRGVHRAVPVPEQLRQRVRHLVHPLHARRRDRRRAHERRSRRRSSARSTRSTRRSGSRGRPGSRRRAAHWALRRAFRTPSTARRRTAAGSQPPRREELR